MKLGDFKSLTEEFGLTAVTWNPAMMKFVPGIIEDKHVYYFVGEHSREPVPHVDALDYEEWFAVCSLLWKEDYVESIYE